MNRSIELCLAALALIASVGAAQSTTQTAARSFAGTWEGTMNDLPGINLTIDQADTKIAGTIVFYLQQRSDSSHPWQVAGATTVPLLSPHVEGGALMFEVEHHRCHGCAELGPNVKFRMELAGPDEARLWNLNETTDSDQGLRIIRQTQAADGASTAPNGQVLQRGISVEMAVTNNASPMPEADDANACIVAVVRDGSIYFGTEKVTAAGLEEAMKSRPRNREAKLYIKADARAPFADVEKVLQAGRTVGFEAPVLLTSQPEQAAPGTIVPPKGLEVLATAPSSAEAIIVQVLDLGDPKPDVRVNGADVSVDVLQYTLGRMLQNRKERLVIVKAAGTLRFAQVVRVIDECRGAGVKLAVARPDL